MMTEWEYIKKEIKDKETMSLAMDGSIPVWSSKDLITLIENIEEKYYVFLGFMIFQRVRCIFYIQKE